MNLSGRNCVVWKVLSESGVGALVNLAMPRFRCVRRNPSRHTYDYGWSFSDWFLVSSVFGAILVDTLMASGIIPCHARSSLVPLI